MCQACDYPVLLHDAGLGVTAHRLHVLEAVGNAVYPLNAAEIFAAVGGDRSINRVTVYRILDSLVDHGLVQRLSGGGRAFFYGLAPNAAHSPHPHFYCRQCGRMDCLAPEAIALDARGLARNCGGEVEKIEIRVDGVCRRCLKGTHYMPTTSPTGQ